MRGTIAIILGGGRGSRLHPLTLERSKPAVGVAGKYRLIDLTLSNCINSGLQRIFVLTQFLSTSLHRHIMQTYRFDAFSDGFVEILAAQQTRERETWYQGTADAVRESLVHIRRYRPGALLILPGDHLCRMDYRDLLRRHFDSGADVTIAVQPVPAAQASRFGLLRTDDELRVRELVEKPEDPADIARFVADPGSLAAFLGDCRDCCLASMGVYVFRPQVLAQVLAEPTHVDFARQIIPAAIRSLRVVVHPFDGYWRDIGTIPAFFEAHMDLLRPATGFRLSQPGWPIYTHARHLPPARIMESQVTNSLIAEGADIEGATIVDSVIGVRSIVRPGARLERVVLMGADYYAGELPEGEAADSAEAMGVGEDAVVRDAIVDKNAGIGAGAVIRSRPGVADEAGEGFWVRDGITVVVKNARIPAGARS